MIIICMTLAFGSYFCDHSRKLYFEEVIFHTQLSNDVVSCNVTAYHKSLIITDI
jgi:hypothetical protein